MKITMMDAARVAELAAACCDAAIGIDDGHHSGRCACERT
jgi:hypothetical protein